MSSTEEQLKSRVPSERLPRHIAVTMDGNGRWAQSRGLPRIEGHRHAVTSVREVVTGCREIGIEFLTLYAFSEENWNRPKAEIDGLMRLLQRFIRSELETMIENSISFDVIGEESRLPARVRKSIDDAREKTADGEMMRLTVALSYGARSEIVRAARLLAQEAVEGKIQVEQIDKDVFAQKLYTSNLPDPDLLIRTSGEWRVSNFLLWQIAYTELWVTPVLWPDFRKKHLLEAIEEYSKRERRFGRVRPTG